MARNRLVIAIAVLAAAAAAIGVGLHMRSTKPARPDFPITPHELIAEISAGKIGGDLLPRGAVKVDLEPGAIRVTYEIGEGFAPITRDQSELVSRGLVQLTIDALMKRGFDPKVHQTLISGHAWEPAPPSPTGRPQARTFGAAHYDFNTDQIMWQTAEER